MRGTHTGKSSSLFKIEWGMALGDAGLKESPYDHPGWAADLGRSWARSGVPGSGLAGTLVGSAIQTPAVAYYGTKRVVKTLLSGVNPPELAEQHKLQVPQIALGPSEERIGPTTQVAHETAPPDPKAKTLLRRMLDRIIAKRKRKKRERS
jgi:hypothetical protein